MRYVGWALAQLFEKERWANAQPSDYSYSGFTLEPAYTNT